MRVIALISLAFALAASSMPLSARSNDLTTTEHQLAGNLGTGAMGNPAGTESGKAGSKPGSGTASGSEVGTVSGRSNNIISSAGAPNALGSGVEGTPQFAEAESAVGKASSATNPATNGTPLRSRAATGGAPGVGTVGEVTKEASGVGKIAQGGSGSVPSGAKGAAQGAAGGAAGSLTGSGSNAQTGNAPV